MNELLLIADICGVVGMWYFLHAELRQLIKIRKTHKVKAISRTAYTSKIKAIIATSIMLSITAMYMSLIVILAEGIIAVWILYLIKKYRRQKE